MALSYNFYLHEYQKNFGNELMKELENKLRQGTIELTIDTEAMKFLFNNFSLFKELELQNIEKQGKIDFFQKEVKRLEMSNEELGHNNQKLFDELAKNKEDDNNVLNSYLSGNYSMSMGFKNMKKSNNAGDGDDVKIILLIRFKNDIEELKIMLKERKAEAQRLLKENDNLIDTNRKMKLENDEVGRVKADSAYKIKKCNQLVSKLSNKFSSLRKRGSLII